MNRPHEAGFSPARDVVRQRTNAASAGARHGEHDGKGDDEMVDREGEGDDNANGEDDGEDYEIEEEDDDGEDDGDDDDEGDEEVGGDSKESDRDQAMHAMKGLPCVPIGQNFTVRGTEFQRTGTKRAACVRCKAANMLSCRKPMASRSSSTRN